MEKQLLNGLAVSKISNKFSNFNRFDFITIFHEMSLKFDCIVSLINEDDDEEKEIEEEKDAVVLKISKKYPNYNIFHFISIFHGTLFFRFDYTVTLINKDDVEVEEIEEEDNDVIIALERSKKYPNFNRFDFITIFHEILSLKFDCIRILIN